MFTEAAIAASWEVQDHGIGPYPLRFLAGCVRAMGLRAALALPQPLIGAEPAELVHGWLAAAVGWQDSIADDEMFARWLDMVATMLAVRRAVGRDVAGRSGRPSPQEGEISSGSPDKPRA